MLVYKVFSIKIEGKTITINLDFTWCWNGHVQSLVADILQLSLTHTYTHDAAVHIRVADALTFAHRCRTIYEKYARAIRRVDSPLKNLLPSALSFWHCSKCMKRKFARNFHRIVKFLFQLLDNTVTFLLCLSFEQGSFSLDKINTSVKSNEHR